MAAQKMEVAGLDCFVARSGYTGEDGFALALKLQARSPACTYVNSGCGLHRPAIPKRIGEDGFEIAVPKGASAKHGVVTLWEARSL